MTIQIVTVEEIFEKGTEEDIGINFKSFHRVNLFLDGGMEWIQRDAVSKHWVDERHRTEIDKNGDPMGIFEYWFENGPITKRIYRLYIKEVE